MHSNLVGGGCISSLSLSLSGPRSRFRVHCGMGACGADCLSASVRQGAWGSDPTEKLFEDIL